MGKLNSGLLGRTVFQFRSFKNNFEVTTRQISKTHMLNLIYLQLLEKKSSPMKNKIAIQKLDSYHSICMTFIVKAINSAILWCMIPSCWLMAAITPFCN